MADELMIERVVKLGKALESLAELPHQMSALTGRVGQVEDRVAHVEFQIVQLRTEMKDGFSAIRSEFLEVFDAGSRATETLFKETWAQMRTLHEDVISRLAPIGEARRGTGADA
jgi:hypothetical protein